MEIKNIDKKKLLGNIETIIDKNLPIMSNLANLSRLFMDTFADTLWSGFYLCDEKCEYLYLGPYQGPLACVKIPFGKGVCGKVVEFKKTILVPNVHEFPGHIACSSLSNSEIVVPIIKNDKVVGVIDLDSALFNNYSEEDQKLLEDASNIISELF